MQKIWRSLPHNTPLGIKGRLQYSSADYRRPSNLSPKSNKLLKKYHPEAPGIHSLAQVLSAHHTTKSNDFIPKNSIIFSLILLQKSRKYT